MKYLKKYILVLGVMFTLVMPMTSNAQIYIATEDESLNSEREGTDVWFGGGVPYQGGDLDQYTPIGDGLLLLAGLAGAYLLGKKRKKQSH